MSDQITLLDVCKLPDVQIHSKTSLFKHIISRQNPQMQKIRENIIKLSYTNKVIGVRGEQVGIISKRLPLKFKLEKSSQKKNKQIERQTVFVSSNFIPHKNFFAAPLPTVKKQRSNKDLQCERYKFLSIDTSRNSTISAGQHYRSTTSLKARTIKSTAKLRPNPKGQQKQPEETASRQNQQSIAQKRVKKSSSEIKRQKSLFNISKNKKSFSNLLKQVNYHHNVHPISHEDNILFKKFQRLNVMAQAILLEEENNKSFQGKYEDLSEQTSKTGRN